METKKLAQKGYKSKHNRIGNWAIWNRTINWNLTIIHKPESVFKKSTHK